MAHRHDLSGWQEMPRPKTPREYEARVAEVAKTFRVQDLDWRKVFELDPVVYVELLEEILLTFATPRRKGPKKYKNDAERDDAFLEARTWIYDHRSKKRVPKHGTEKDSNSSAPLSTTNW